MIRAFVVNDKLVRIERWLMADLYAVPGVAGRWRFDHTGNAVCPLTQAEIDRALRESKS